MNSKTRGAGRPREFDETEVLLKLMEVFWSRGFDGTSMSDLVAAAGVQKASLYAAYGDKRSIYLKALSSYDDRLVAAIRDVLGNAGTARDRFTRLFCGGIDRAASGDLRGCFICSAAADQADIDPRAREIVQDGLDRLESLFSDVLAGPLADEAARATAARHLLAVYVGIQSLARAGYPSQSLISVLRAAINSIPLEGASA